MTAAPSNRHASLVQWLERHIGELEALVLDIDGVLLIESRPTRGSRRLLDLVKQHGTPLSLLTNDANHSPREKARTLQASGLKISADEIISSGDGLVEVVERFGVQGELFFVMGDFGNPCFGEKAGLTITRQIRDLPKCSGVIVGEDHYDWEPVINGVVNYFVGWPEGLFVVPNPDEFYPRAGGDIHIGAGGVARFIERVLAAYGIAINPVYLGKPYSPIFEHNHRHLEKRIGKPIERSNILMIGDLPEADIKGANAFGYRSGLLLSGVTRPDRALRASDTPDFLFEAL
ncbi:MAG: HAD hydrolase-like protein [Deltaproteobacteria bacterium]|nr:HAD hydrolase-like protein [Deltaproteobacteria bacterium]